jgi:hypothetical protein
MLHKTIKSSTNLFCKTLLFVFMVVLFFLPMSIPCYAEDIAAITEELKSLLTTTGVAWPGEIDRITKFLKEKEKEVSPFSLSIAAGFNGHKAGEEELYKLDLKTKMTYDAYPKEFRFDAGTNVQLRNDKLQENVTSLLINYDHHLETWLEIYGFAERFSDNYLSILQRYETGGGIKFELDLLGPEMKGDIRTYRDDSEVYENLKGNIKGIPDSVKSQEEKELLLGKLQALKKEGTRIVEALKKKYAWLSLGMAVTVLSELEKPEIETFIDEIVEENGTTRIQETTKTTKIALDGEHRFRIVLRPSIVIRPWPTLSLEGIHYRKYPLGNPKRVDGRLDYRTDSHVLLKVFLSKIPDWAKEVALIFGYYHHYDNLPPRVPQSIIDENIAAKKSLRKTVAEDTHEEFVFSLAIKF